MKNKKTYVEYFLFLTLCASRVFSDEDPHSTLNSTNEDNYSHPDDNREQVFSSSTISEKVPDPVGIPEGNHPKSHHHGKNNKPIDSVNSHTRSPVYEVVNQPCYAPGCGGFGPQDSLGGNRWQPGRNRYGPYPKYVEPIPRRRGGYGYPGRGAYGEVAYPQPSYRPNYGPQYPDYGYNPRGMPAYPQDRYDRSGGYGRAPYDDYFLG